MARARTFLLILAALALVPVARAEEPLSAWLERLGSDRWRERELAQRWLATHLETRDYAELARAAEGGDAEVRRRIGEALAAEDRHLGLAVLLASERREELVALGRRAFQELVLRWCPTAHRPAARSSKVLERLAERDAGRYALSGVEEPSARALDRLARLADLTVPLVVSPGLVDRPPARTQALEGTATALLGELGRGDRSTLSGVGDWEAEELGPATWVLAATPEEVFEGHAVDWLLRWCRAVQAARGPAAGAAASARALAATGWPAAVGWLEERWLVQRDPNALSGLLAAAERGRVAPGLTAPGERRRVLEFADRALATEGGEPAAERAARALAAAGAASPVGEDPGLELLEGIEGLARGPLWVRLVALEGVRSPSPRVEQAVRAVATDPADLPPELRLQALRTLAARPPGSEGGRPPARLGELFDHARAEGRAEELAGLLAALGGDPCAALRAAGFGDRSASEVRRLFLLELAYRSGAELAVELLREEVRRAGRRIETGTPLASLLAGWVRRDGGDRTAALLARAAAGLGPAEGAAAERLAALAGCLSPARQVALVEEIAASGAAPGAEELELLGALAAGPRGGTARGLLLTELEARRGGEPLVRALDRATVELRRQLLDADHADFARAVWAAVAPRTHPLHARLAPPAWPRPVLVEATPLRWLDRRLPVSR